MQGGAELVLPFLPHGHVLKNSPLDIGAHTKSELSSDFSGVSPTANKCVSSLHADSELICVLQEDAIHAECLTACIE